MVLDQTKHEVPDELWCSVSSLLHVSKYHFTMTLPVFARMSVDGVNMLHNYSCRQCEACNYNILLIHTYYVSYNWWTDDVLIYISWYSWTKKKQWFNIKGREYEGNKLIKIDCLTMQEAEESWQWRICWHLPDECVIPVFQGIVLDKAFVDIFII